MLLNYFQADFMFENELIPEGVGITHSGFDFSLHAELVYHSYFLCAITLYPCIEYIDT